MTHVITQTAEILKSALLAGVQSVDGRVYRSRLYQIQPHEIPCVLVSFEAETASRIDGGPVRPRILTRTSRWSVVGVHRLSDPENVEDALIDLAREIETSVSNIAGDLIHDVRVTGTDLQLSDEGESPVGYVRVSIECITRTRDSDPAQPL